MPELLPSPPERIVLRSEDLDETRDVVAQVFCPHELTLLDGARGLTAQYRSTQLGEVGLSHLDYGAAVRIRPHRERDFFLVEIPLGGRSEVVAGRERVLADSGTGVVLSPQEPFVTSRSAGSPQLILRIERHAMERQLATLLGRPVVRSLRFSPALDLQAPQGLSWRRSVDLLRAEIEVDGPLVQSPLALTQLRSLLLTQLLLGQASNYSEALRATASTPLPKVIKRAAETLEDHAAEPLSVEDVAETVGISVRALQDGFRRHLGCSPTEYLRRVRLERVHSELTAADAATTTVTDVALKWGFVHLGRFAAEYRRRFAESPSATLRGCATPRRQGR